MTNALRSPGVTLPRSRPNRFVRAATTVAAVLGAAVLGIAVSPGNDLTIEAAEGGTLGSGGEFQEIDPDRRVNKNNLRSIIADRSSNTIHETE